MTELEEDDVALLVDIDCFRSSGRSSTRRSPPRARAVSSAARNQAIISTPTDSSSPRCSWRFPDAPGIGSVGRAFGPTPQTTSRSVSTRSRRRRASRSTCSPLGVDRAQMASGRCRALRVGDILQRRGLPPLRIPKDAFLLHFLRRCRGRAERSSGRLFRADGERSVSRKSTVGAPLHALAQGRLAASLVQGAARSDNVISVYVINLARSPERRAWMEAELARADAEPTFCKLSTDAASARIARAALAGAFQGRSGADSQPPQGLAGVLASGAHAVMLEDDVHSAGISGDAHLDWAAGASTPSNWKRCSTKSGIATRRTCGERRLHRLGAEHLGAAAYLLSRAGARKMLAATRPCHRSTRHCSDAARSATARSGRSNWCRRSRYRTIFCPTRRRAAG